MTQLHAELASRVGRLERMNRLLTAVAVGLVATLVYSAVRPPQLLRATSFELVDATGAVRAELRMRGADPGLYLKDAGGSDRVAVFHDTSMSGMYVFDSTGTTRVGVVQFAHGGGGFALHGPASKGAAVLYLKGEGSLRFFDADGAVTNSVLASDK